MGRKILNLLKHPFEIMVTFDHRGWLKWMNDKTFLSLLGRKRLGENFNIEPPQTFNEKLNWLKLYNHNPLCIMMADKYEVKEVVAKRGEKTAKCFGVYRSFDEILTH
jgi:hypothetical protein